MIKEKLYDALLKSDNLIMKENDNLPLGMRGELEVIVTDRNGNIVSYEKGHNQVTNLAKMTLVHLLAGEIAPYDSHLYSIEEENKNVYITAPSGSTPVEIIQRHRSFDHDAGNNYSGTMLSGTGYFSDYGTPELDQDIISISETSSDTKSHTINYPTKMLFGTGLEAHDKASLISAYTSEGVSGSYGVVNKVNGFAGESETEYANDFFTYIEDAQNYYSASNLKERTLQPITTSPKSSSVDPTETYITGAIKNCLISYSSECSGENSKYDSDEKMAKGAYRGLGRPAFVYAKRTREKFYSNESDDYVRYSIRSTTDNSSAYETKLTYSVILPAQSSSSSGSASYNPYNGWILKEAGLFCDARYVLRSSDTTEPYSSSAMYRDSASGMLLFKRNLSSPILKQTDLQVQFNWNIYITI